MYKTRTFIDPSGNHIEHISMDTPNGGTLSFPNVESNNGPERQAYLAWLEAGNTPLPADEQGVQQ
jgi:hypothetical protein